MKYVAFLDILGFKNTLRNLKHSGAKSYIVKFSLEIYNEWKRNNKNSLDGYVISDSLIINSKDVSEKSLHDIINVTYEICRKEFIKKINYISSKKIKEYMTNTKIYCDDFENFLKEVKPKKGDFIFLDPPYDTEFSTYAKNEFAKNDQVRLCEYLKNTKANIMLIIKNTDFIYNLYNTKEFRIKTFDKKYLVSFQNRNDKDVEHLLITNY